MSCSLEAVPVSTPRDFFMSIIGMKTLDFNYRLDS